MKKFSMPVKWTVQSYVVVEAENEEDAAQKRWVSTPMHPSKQPRVC